MAYYNGFPATYTPLTPVQVQPPQTYTQMQQAQQGSIIWVQGEAGAKSYLVAPNNTVQLWDSENQVIYLKSADASGMPSMKVLDYTIRESAQNGSNKRFQNQDEQIPIYATKDELKAVSDEIKAIKSRLEEHG